MDHFNNFINSLCCLQEPFTKNQNNTWQNPISQLKLAPERDFLQTYYPNMFPDDFSKLSTFVLGQNYNIYKSIICQLCPKYNMLYCFEQQIELIEEFIRFLISRMNIDVKIKQTIQSTNIKPSQLIKEIKQMIYYSQCVVWYISLVLELNIIVLTTNGIELYYGTANYDKYNPHILLGKNEHNVYQPIVYGNNRLLSYFENHIIKSIIDSKMAHEINCIIINKN